VGRGRSRHPMVAVATAVLVLGSGLVVGTQPAVADGTVRVMQYNICGAICNDGVVAKAGSNNDVVEDVRNRILASRPHLVMLNEVCVGQFGRIKDLLRGSAWPMNGAFRAQRKDGRCKGGFGDAVLTAGRVRGTEVVQLPDRGSEDRAVLCLNTDAHGAVLACSLHLVTGKHNGRRERLEQLAKVARVFNARAGHRAVIVGGDFNTTPSGMGALTNPARGGRFFDVDPQKAPTRGTKIDYVLFDRKHFSNPSGGPVKSKFSDHRLLTGRASRR
jgi:hypothetical protein